MLLIHVFRCLHVMKCVGLKKPFVLIALLSTLSVALGMQGDEPPNVAGQRVSFKWVNMPAKGALAELTAKTGVRFAYAESVFRNSPPITAEATDEPLTTVLNSIFVPEGITYRVNGDMVILNRTAQSGQVKAEGRVQSREIKGTLTDSAGNVLPGVSVKVKDQPSIGTTTDVNGRYILTVPNNAVLVFSFVGFVSQEIPIGTQTVIDVVMQSDAGSLEEVVVVGFGTQKKLTTIGAQSTVSVKELKQPVRNLTTVLAGRLSGVIAVQRSGEPGYDDANVWVRGISTFNAAGSNPLILVDGVQRPMSNIDPEDIESFSILKDASATAVYGVRGANGVILINTKKGTVGKPTINLGVNRGTTTFVRLPEFADGVTFMEMANEARTTRGNSPWFSEEMIRQTANGSDPLLYPNVDWMNEVFKKQGSNTRVNLNITGGSENANYYVSTAYYTEDGLLKTDELASYNSQMKFDRYNFTSNLNLNITKTTKLELGVQGFITNGNYPGRPMSAIFNSVMLASPIIHPPKYEDGRIAKELAGVENPYALLTQTGFSTQWKNQLMSNIRLRQDLAFLLPGLSINSMFSFDAYNEHFVNRTKTPDTWVARSRDADGKLVYQQTGIGSEFLGYSRTNGGNRQFYTETALNYQRTFGDHDVAGMLLYNQSDRINGFENDFILSLPFRSRGLAGRATYAFREKYLAEVNFGYNGSENFAPEKRYGFFPSLGLGWVVSREKFFEPLEDIFQLFKFRFSHGLVGNSNIDPNNNRRFGYIGTIATTTGYTFGRDYSNTYTGLDIGEYAVDVTWEESKKTNLGVDLWAFGSSLNLQADVFRERREGIFVRREAVPRYLGIRTNPYGNLGITENQGIDLSMDFNKRFNTVNLGVRGTFTYATSKIIEDDLPPWEYPWRERKGLRIGKRFGYIAEGLFTSEEEIANSAVQSGNELPGDIKYKDVNGDGMISLADEVAIGYGSVPEIVYGFGFTAAYKGFSLGAFFQGIGNVDVRLNGEGFVPFQQGVSRGNLLKEITNRWTPENPSQDVFYPRLAEGDATYNYRASTWWLKNGKYLRLKTMELAYNMPERWFKRYGVSNMRLYALGFNLLTFSPFKLWDVELGDGRGTVYPQHKTVSLGLDIRF